MATHLRCWFFGGLLLLVPTLKAQESVRQPTMAAAEAEIARLRTENEALRAENQRLRAALVNGAAQEKQEQATETGYWLTASSNKRHNKKCKNYKVTKGRFCTKDEGTPCKICGG